MISNGIVPRYADIDAGAMVVAAVDEAVRNAVCVGVDVDRMAGLDNFCWPDPSCPKRPPTGDSNSPNSFAPTVNWSACAGLTACRACRARIR